MVNVLMLSKWHVHAAGYARFVAGQPDAQITCVWDEDKGTPTPFGPDSGIALTELLQNAYISHNEQRIVKI